MSATDIQSALQPGTAATIEKGSTTVSRPPSDLRDAITLGIVGGGQLAKMTAQAAAQLGCKVVILERQPEFPAGSVAARTLIGEWNDPASLLELAARADVVTLENEFVDAGALAVLEERGHALWPSATTVRLIQDKLVQKHTLADAGLPVPRMRAVERVEDVASLAGEWGLPLLLKARRNAYDGKGNATVRSPATRLRRVHAPCPRDRSDRRFGRYARGQCPVLRLQW